MQIRNFFAPILAACVLAGCGQDIPDEAPYVPDYSRILPVSFSEGLSRIAWQFDQDTCRAVFLDGNMEDVLNFDRNLGDRIAIFATDNAGAISINGRKAGNEASAYSVTFTKDVPYVETYSGSLPDGDGLNVNTMDPVQACVELALLNAEGNDASIKLKIKGMADTWYPGTGKFKCSDTIRSLEISDGKPVYIVPASEGCLDACLEVELEGTKHTFNLDLDKPLGVGQTFTVSVDCGKVPAFRDLDVSWGFGEGKEFSPVGSKTVSINPLKDFTDKNKYYNVFVQQDDGSWKSIEVRNVLCSDASNHGYIGHDWDNSLGKRDTMAVAIFEHPFDKPVKVRVEKRRGEDKAPVIRPTLAAIEAVPAGSRCYEFTIPDYGSRKLSVEFGGDRYHNLFLIGTRVDEQKPLPSDKVHYFGPGEWDVEQMTLNDDETLYVDYGGVVYGQIVVKGKDVTIAGHGIISGEKLLHWGKEYSNGACLIDNNWDKMSGIKNFTMRDITLIDSPSWTVRIFNQTNVLIDGVNIVSWELNGDGIDICSCHDVEIKNCLIRTYDDCITLKCRFTASPLVSTYNVDVHDNLIWNDYARGIVVGPEAGNRDYGTYHLHDIDIHDCTFLENAFSSSRYDVRAALAIGQYASPDYSWGGGAANETKDIRIHDLVFDNIRPDGRNIFIKQDSEMSSPCHMSNILFENITILDKKGNRNPYFAIEPNQNTISGLVVRNLTVNGKQITGVDKQKFVIYNNPGNVEVTFD